MRLGRDQRKIVAVASQQCKRKLPDPDGDLTGSRVEEEHIAVIRADYREITLTLRLCPTVGLGKGRLGQKEKVLM
jgi:hypothetical protein